ncbi:MAG: hypothetical protein MJ187_02695 [Alphaproteobacteria bacterium]|nr:hypothetical protein [Alphaproteobacteria bacterium]
MLRKNKKFVVGLTTFNLEMLRISIPALGRLPRNFVLIIYNDNPAVRLQRRTVRKLGYRGDLKIINGVENVGLLGARVEIIRHAQKFAKHAQWIVFVDDDDMLTALGDVPDVAVDNFAIVQSAIVFNHRILDLFCAIENPESCVPDGENVVLVRPHFGFAGTLIRMDTAIGFADALNAIMFDLQKISDSLNFYPPIDAAMWTMLGTYARSLSATASPIFMDTQNYISVKIDNSNTKYGLPATPVRSPIECYENAINRYNACLSNYLQSVDAAAQHGQD